MVDCDWLPASAGTTRAGWEGGRTMRRMGRLYVYLFLLLFAVGLVLALLGFDLDRIDLWLEDRAGLFDAVGSRLFNVLCGAILALCIVAVVGGLWQRFVAPRGHMGDATDFVAETAAVDELGVDELAVEETRPVGWGCMLVAVIVGYFAWFGMTG